MILTVFLLIIYFYFFAQVFKNSLKGETYFILLYIIFFLPIYSIFQLIVYKFSETQLLVNLIKFSKDLIFYLFFIIFIFGSSFSFYKKKWNFSFLDKLFFFLMFLTVIFVIFPIGEANFISKVLYAKNLFIIGIVYFLGRQNKFSHEKIPKIFKILTIIFSVSCGLALLEYVFEIHLHTILEYAIFNLDFNDISPSGNYQLSWTFERQGVLPRYGSFFADPLEFSASLLLALSIAFFYFVNSKIRKNKFIFLTMILFYLLGFYLSFSRSAIFGIIVIIFFTMIITRSYKTLSRLIFSFTILLFSYYYFSDLETKYFILDTLSFQNTSSIGHLLEWIEGIESIINSPFGIGLATSGNASSVDQVIGIGGENQFLIFGVQLGLFGIVLYSSILIKSIYNCAKLYMYENKYNLKMISFVTSCTKIGLIIPLMTANAEIYLFISLITWFFVGYCESYYQNLINK